MVTGRVVRRVLVEPIAAPARKPGDRVIPEGPRIVVPKPARVLVPA